MTSLHHFYYRGMPPLNVGAAISWKVNLFWLRCNITRTIKINVANPCIHTYAHMHIFTCRDILYDALRIIEIRPYSIIYWWRLFSKGNGLIISNFNNFAFTIKLCLMVYILFDLNGCNLIVHGMNISSINIFPFRRRIFLAMYLCIISK